ncbi:MAG: acetyl/propionyl/methylcrotonyl-CoA carboxylase subunit alpha [Alphaproteobacteria bacterium]|nr:acetyl/propionyl/methylcrotonyl-CoA carboxylase subunit alpha [Alphaproteobacteria bacterium]
MFNKILIANRGEIACRIIKTARKMGIKTVAVYSDADADALHRLMADEAVHIGPSSSAHSYLVIDNIVQACKKTGAEAVHPGYGFLSENRKFQEALSAAGIVFIGPDAHAIYAMGDKIESKKLAREAGVSTVPGYLDVIKNPEEAVEIARSIGYPVMIKASAGGGGKGMRIAFDDAQCIEGFVSATNEAKLAFADDRVFIEKYVDQPRHIEIQVLADGYGNTLYLGERECSIQRRHQKVIEEAPSPFLDEETRRSMGEQAVALCRAVKYKSAGTVEFIVDSKRNFYFLEMNTRLQVEHPVTELVTGLDIVELMIKVAAGEALPVTQREVRLHGWAVECRIYAEDPFRGFMPSTGRLNRYIQPPESSAVRVDSGVYEGGEISMYYDPMIAKLVTYGDSRTQAIQYMRDALDHFYICGVSHNIPFLASIMAKQRFVEGRLTTNFIAEEYPNGFHIADLPPENPDILVTVAASIQRQHADREARISGQFLGHEMVVADEWVVRMNKSNHPVSVRTTEGGYDVVVNTKRFALRTNWDFGQPLLRGTINGRQICVQVERRGVDYRLLHAGTQADCLVLTPLGAQLASYMPVKAPPDMSRYLLSPMPGLLVSVAVSDGQEIKAGETLAVVEAMKMENILRAERDGVVKQIHALPGDSLAVDQIILEFENTKAA